LAERIPMASWQGQLGSVRLEYSRFLRTHDKYELYDDLGTLTALVFHSETALLYLYAKVCWHDDWQHCPTWTAVDECRCDVEAALG
jgi:hypothetical protein